MMGIFRNKIIYIIIHIIIILFRMIPNIIFIYFLIGKSSGILFDIFFILAFYLAYLLIYFLA